MPSTKLKQRVMFAPGDMLSLVADVEKYPEFISMISALRITKRNKPQSGPEAFEAEAVIAYKFLSEAFISKVRIDPDARVISVTKADRSGAVKSLSNRWVFYELSDGSTLIDFDVDVRLKAFPLEMLAREKFGKVAQKIMDMFIKRAEDICQKTGREDLDVRAEMATLKLRA
ncbi:MAG: type II toxin-antitoxin system RatA family toxin [Maricaulaceae bacterium]